MAGFLVELYVARHDRDIVERHVEQARAAAEELAREGVAVRCLRSIFLPEDETCLLLYDAARAEDVAEAARRAGVSYERIVEAVIGGR
jgi:hypothetical protein